MCVRLKKQNKNANQCDDKWEVTGTEVICFTLLKSGLEGYCASSSTVIGQIHRDFLPITGSWHYLNDFSSEADKSVFLLNSSICCVLLQIKQHWHGFSGKSGKCISMEVMCLEIVKKPPRTLNPIVTCCCSTAWNILLCNPWTSRWPFPWKLIVFFSDKQSYSECKTRTCMCSFTTRERRKGRMEGAKVDFTQQCHLAHSTVDSAKLKMLISSLSTR